MSLAGQAYVFQHTVNLLRHELRRITLQLRYIESCSFEIYVFVRNYVCNILVYFLFLFCHIDIVYKCIVLLYIVEIHLLTYCCIQNVSDSDLMLWWTCPA